MARDDIGRGYFARVFTPADLCAALVGKWVAFDEQGNQIAYTVPNDIGPAALSVSPVTDALKTVDGAGLLIGSADKNAFWAVDAIVLNVVVLDRLPDRSYTAEDLIEEVTRVGFAWQISPTSSPSAPNT